MTVTDELTTPVVGDREWAQLVSQQDPRSGQREVGEGWRLAQHWAEQQGRANSGVSSGRLSSGESERLSGVCVNGATASPPVIKP